MVSMQNSVDLSAYQAKLADVTSKLALFKRLLKAMEGDHLSDELLEHMPTLEQEIRESAKLEYRAQILRRSVIEQESANSKRAQVCEGSGLAVETKKHKTVASVDASNVPVKRENKVGVQKIGKARRSYVIVEDYGSSLLCMLRSLFTDAIGKAYAQLDDVQVVLAEASQDKFGDYQFNSAMAISQMLKQMGHKTSPQEVAKTILQNIADCERIEKLELAGPGYINIFLNKTWVGKEIGNIASKGVPIPRLKKCRVVVDFSSPNIAKEMHVGHLRSTIIGDSLCRLMEFVGFDVVRINHIGDWGTQFGMLIAHLYDRFPNFVRESPPIADLQAFYKESKRRFDEDEAFKKRAYECVVKLQAEDSETVQAWRLICDVSRLDFSRIYERLDVKIVERGESFYQKRMVKLVEMLDEQGALELDEGRKILRIDDGVPLTVVKSDGGFTYDTSDLAALKHRLEEEKADWLIYVVDAGQSLHFDLIFAAGRRLGWYSMESKRIEHVSFGLVLGEDKKKFKTRSGDTVKLTELLEEGLKRASAKLEEKERDRVMSTEELCSAREALAYGCVKYADLSQTRTQDYVFSFDRMLDDRGNTAVYLLYAYARIRSICRNTGVTDEDVSKYIACLPDGVLPIEHCAEFKLAKSILKFSDCVLTALDNFMLHQVCDYIYSVATTFHDFYNECYVINKDKQGNTVLHYNRLVLCRVTADIMANCFQILGLRTIERM